MEYIYHNVKESQKLSKKVFCQWRGKIFIEKIEIELLDLFEIFLEDTKLECCIYVSNGFFLVFFVSEQDIQNFYKYILNVLENE